MSQISPPVRILLIAAVAFLGAYMMFLRPKEDVVPPAETTAAPNTQTSEPAVTGPGQAVEAAQGAVAAANGETTAPATDATAGTAAATTEAPASRPGVAAAKDLEGVPAGVRKALRQGDVLVLLFWNRKGADDRDVRRALRRVDTWGGRVSVQAEPLGAIGRYGRIARGVDVNQTPTVVVVDPELNAETIVGFTDTQSIDQLVVDALKNTTGLFTSSYLREVNAVCAQYEDAFFSANLPESPAQFGPFVGRITERFADFRRALTALPAPKRYAGFRRAALADVNALGVVYADWARSLGSRPTAARLVATSERFAPRERKHLRSFERRAERENLLACADSV